MKQMIDEGVRTDTAHALREGLTLTQGWLQVLFKRWDGLDDAERHEMVAGALLGVHRCIATLDTGDSIVGAQRAHERMAEEFERLDGN